MDTAFWHVVTLSVIEIYGDFNLRWYAQTDKSFYLGQGIIGYIGVLYFLIQSLRHQNVLYVNSMWDGVSGLIESIAAYVLLGDRLETSGQYMGVVLVIIGIFLLKDK